MLTITWDLVSDSSNIKDHWSQVTKRNVMTMKKLEIFREVPKCDRKIQNEQMLLGKWCWNPCSTQGCHTLQFIRSTIKWGTINWGMPIMESYVMALKCYLHLHSIGSASQLTKSDISGVTKYRPQTESEKIIEKNNIFDYLILGS